MDNCSLCNPPPLPAEKVKNHVCNMGFDFSTYSFCILRGTTIPWYQSKFRAVNLMYELLEAITTSKSVFVCPWRLGGPEKF